MAASLEASLKAETSWARAVVFGADGAVIGSTFQASKDELKPYLTALDDKVRLPSRRWRRESNGAVGQFVWDADGRLADEQDRCIGMGFDLAGEHFDVHR